MRRYHKEVVVTYSLSHIINTQVVRKEYEFQQLPARKQSSRLILIMLVMK